MIRRLSESDDPSGFSSGDHDLDDFLKRHALANARAGIGVTYVSTGAAGHIVGYLTVAFTAVKAIELPAAPGSMRHLPAYPLPALLIARLAVDRRHRRSGIGTRLLRFALEEALVAHERFGCTTVIVDPKPDAAPFYERFGFRPDRHREPGAQARLFLSMQELTQAPRPEG